MKRRLPKAISALLIFALLLSMGTLAVEMEDVLPVDCFYLYKGLNTIPLADSPPFADIEGHWAYGTIGFMFERGFMQGTSDTTFAPDVAFSRAMAVTILYRMVDEPTPPSGSAFHDVAPGQWYSQAVAWAHANGVVEGTGGGRFAPTVHITREEMVTILYRFAVSQGHDVTLTTSDALDFPDADLIHDWAEAAMAWAVYNGLIVGTNLGMLHPDATMTRAEAATLLSRFQKRSELPSAEDFELTISIEETSLPQGEPFMVNVELRNNSGEDHEIVHVLLFLPHLPGWHIGMPVDPPEPQSRFFEAGSAIRDTWHIGSPLEPGIHELRFTATFLLILQDSHQPIQVWSNTIMLTVQ